MTNKERYKQAFGALQAKDLNVGALSQSRIHSQFKRRILAVAVCAALIVAGAITAYAYGDEILEIIHGWGGNLTITLTENGDNSVSLNTEDLTDPVAIEHGRMYLVVNGQHLDITKEISPDTPYRYNYTDEKNYTHYFVIGLKTADLNSYGYGEFIQDENGQIIGGYTARLDIQKDGKTINWMDEAKKELHIP